MTEAQTISDFHKKVQLISDDDLIEASQEVYDLKQIDLNNIKIYLRTNITYDDHYFQILYITNLYHNCIVNGRIEPDGHYEIDFSEPEEITTFLTTIYRHAKPTELQSINRLINIMYPQDQLWIADTNLKQIDNTEYTKQ